MLLLSKILYLEVHISISLTQPKRPADLYYILCKIEIHIFIISSRPERPIDPDLDYINLAQRSTN